MDNSKYATAVGIIRALENKLLKFTDLERLLSVEKAETLLEELSETPYGEYIGRIKEINEFEFLLNSELKKTYKIISELSLNPEITNLFFLKKDLHNLKIILKNKYSNLIGEEYLVDLGLFSLPVLKEMVEKNNYTKFPFRVNLQGEPWTIGQAVEKAIKQVEQTSETELIDFFLDSAFYQMSLETTKKYRNIFLERLFKLEIDTNNLKTLVRFIVTKKDKKYLQDAWIPGGDLSGDFFLPEIVEKEKDLLQKVHQARYERLISYERDLSAKETTLPFLEEYEKIITLGISSWEKMHTFSDLEKIIDNFLINYLKKAKHISLGIEPLIGYLSAKEMEIKNIRLIIFGKITNLPLEMIRQNLREAYI